MAPGAGTLASYVEGTESDFTDAKAYADAQIGGGIVDYVAVQVGANVIVFADTGDDDGSADDGLVLVNASITAIDESNFV